MKEFKGTKGPWFTKKSMADFYEIAIDNEEHSQSFAIVTCNKYIGINEAKMIANAKLIAAAPQLLEACQKGLDAKTMNEMQAARKLMFYAITKALVE